MSRFFTLILILIAGTAMRNRTIMSGLTSVKHIINSRLPQMAFTAFLLLYSSQQECPPRMQKIFNFSAMASKYRYLHFCYQWPPVFHRLYRILGTDERRETG